MKIAIIKINTLRFIVIFLITFTFSAHADMTIKKLNYINISGNFTKVENVWDLPAPILEKLKKQKTDCPGIANHNEDFDAGCSMSPPCQKFINGGHFNNVWFIEYLSGGAGLSDEFLAFRLENEKIASVLRYMSYDANLNKGKINLTTSELEQKLMLPSNCLATGKMQWQHIAEVMYGVCVPQENDFYRKYILE